MSDRKACKRAGKRVLVWVCGSVSQQMTKIADEPEWLDEILKLDQDLAGSSSRQILRSTAAKPDELVSLALICESLSHQVHGMHWFSPGQLLDAMVAGWVDTEVRMMAQPVLANAKAQNVLCVGQRPKLRLNAAHETIEALTLNSTLS